MPVNKGFDGKAERLPYGHAFRLLQNRKPETGSYWRESRNYQPEYADKIRLMCRMLRGLDLCLCFQKQCGCSPLAYRQSTRE